MLYIVGINEVGDILTIPMHSECVESPKKTITLARKVMEDRYILDELTGKTKLQRTVKTQDRDVTKYVLKEGYIIDHISGKAHKLDKDGKICNEDHLLSDATEMVEETISEIVYEDMEFEL